MRDANRRGSDRFYIIFCLIVAATIRLHLLIASNFVIDADEAIVGLMAKHILQGRGIPVFYYGQHYMGSLEPILAAVSFYIFGMHTWALKLVPILFSLALIPLLYRLVSEVASQRAARIATILLAVPPAALVEWSGKARGGFIEVVVLGTCAFLYTVRFLRDEQLRRQHIFIAAFLLGVGWWVNNQIIYFMLPIGVAVLGRLIYASHVTLRAKIKLCISTLGIFLIGGLPYWIYNLKNSFISFEILTGSNSGQLKDHLIGLFTQAIPILIGAERFWHDEELFNGSIGIGYLLYGSLLAAYIFYRRRQIADIFRLRFDWGAPWELFALFVGGGLLIFTTSSYGYLVQAPRYLLPLYVGVFTLCGVTIALFEGQRRWIGNCIGIFLLILNIASSYYGGLAIPGEPHVFNGERVSRDHTELLAWLREQKIHLVRTNYWIGYRLAFESNEDVRFKIFHEPYQVRIPDYESEGDETNPLGLPIIAVPSQALYIRHGLETLAVAYKEVVKSGYHIFYNVDLPDPKSLKQLSHDRYSLTSNLNSSHLREAMDGDLNTRWGTGKPQEPGMWVTITITPPVTLKLMLVELGKFVTDFPRNVEISAKDGDGHEELIFSESEFLAVQYFMDNGRDLDLLLPPREYSSITIRQVGRDTFFDWSIAELKLFQG